jgi:hypothetical protein
MNIPFDLDHYLEGLSERIGRAGTVAVNRRFETARLRSIPHSELIASATKHRMNVVRRVGGEIYDFTRRASA